MDNWQKKALWSVLFLLTGILVHFLIQFVTTHRQPDPLVTFSTGSQSNGLTGMPSYHVTEKLLRTPLKEIAQTKFEKKAPQGNALPVSSKVAGITCSEPTTEESENGLMFTVPVLGEDYQVSDEIMEAMKLSPNQRSQIKELALRQLGRVQEWERQHAEVIEEIPAAVLTYAVSGSPVLADECQRTLTDELKAIVGEMNFDMLAGQIEFLAKQLARDRIVTYYTEPNPSDGTCSYEFSVQWEDPSSKSPDWFVISEPELSEIPWRWKHLFALTGQEER